MNKGWILSHLREAHEELTKTITRIEAEDPVDEVLLEISLEHAYNHLNTAWNSRAMDDKAVAFLSEDDFYAWRQFPTDIHMGR